MKPQHQITLAWLEPVTFSEEEGPRLVLLGVVHAGTVYRLRRTSPVVRIDGNRVETENSVYVVQEWARVPSSEELLEIWRRGGGGLALH